MNVPEPLPVYTTAYQDFKGVDFTSAIPDRSHFPIGKNFVITDEVKKRNGYEEMAGFEGKINGIFKFELKKEKYTLVHAGTVIYSTDEDFKNPKVFIENLPDEKSKGMYTINDEFIIATGEEFICISIQDYGSNVDFIEHKAVGPFVSNEVSTAVTDIKNITLKEIPQEYYTSNGNSVDIQITPETLPFFNRNIDIEIETGEPTKDGYTKANSQINLEIGDKIKFNTKSCYSLPRNNSTKTIYENEGTFKINELVEGKDYIYSFESKEIIFSFTDSVIFYAGKDVNCSLKYTHKYMSNFEECTSEGTVNFTIVLPDKISVCLNSEYTCELNGFESGIDYK